MRWCLWLGTMCVCLVISSVCHALLITEEGNKPLAEANYKDWPGLVHALNDESRVRLVWCNGHETLYFAGETADLNRVLAAFGKTQVPKLEVLILPGSSDLVPASEPSPRVDWLIDVHGGIAGGFAQAENLELVMPLHPRLIIYISDRIDLKQMEIPDHILVSHRDDRIAALKVAITGENASLKQYAEAEIQNLTPELPQESRLEYERRVANISAWVTHRNSKRPTTAPGG